MVGKPALATERGVRQYRHRGSTRVAAGRASGSAAGARSRAPARPASSPRFDTVKGTTKSSPQRSQVAAVARPARINPSWLIVQSRSPTTSERRTVRRRWCGRAQ